MCQHVWRIALFYNKKTASHDAAFSYQKQEREWNYWVKQQEYTN